MCTSFWICSSPNWRMAEFCYIGIQVKSELLRAMSSLQFLTCKSRMVTARDNTPHHPQRQRTRSLSDEEGHSAVSLSRTQDSTHLSQTGWGLWHPQYFRMITYYLILSRAPDGVCSLICKLVTIYNKNEMRWCVENHFETNNGPADLIPKLIRQIQLRCKL